jgi:carbohydrate-selective porin OprB
MRENNTAKTLLILIFLLFCSKPLRADVTCKVPDVGTLKPHEFKIHVGLTNYWQGAWGGVNTKNADRISGLYDLDLCYLVSAKEHSAGLGDYVLLAVSAQSSFGEGISDSKVGSFFNLNEGVKGNYCIIVDKLFVEFTGHDRLFTVNVGKIDLIDYFDHSAVANEFKDQFFAYPLVQTDNIPFPCKGLGIRAQYDPTPFWYAEAGIGDAKADSRETGFNTAFSNDPEYFSIGEIGIRPNLFNKEGTYRFMIWYDTQDKPYLNRSAHTKHGDTGFAMSFDQKLMEKVTGFLRYGWADDKVNEEEDFVSFGAQIEGPIEGREKDVFAVGYAHGLRSPNGLSSSEDEREMDLIEAYYRIQVNDNIQISPDIQWVTHPGGLESESPAIVFGLRVRMKF